MTQVRALGPPSSQDGVTDFSAEAAPQASPASRAHDPESLLVAGVDEAGRGPLAGPLVVAAVILDPQRRIDGIGDSKALSAARREALFPLIVSQSLAYFIVVIEPVEIDRLNIFQATMLGMRRALLGLPLAPRSALIDGNKLPTDLPCTARAIVSGDASEPAIGAASILAKVTRDRLMIELDRLHPGYGFARHKGYPTPDHFAALQRLGPCPQHRQSFAPVRGAQADLFEV